MMTKKPLLKITAKHKLTGKRVDLEFVSIKQAKFFNHDLVDFREVGFVNTEQKRLQKNNLSVPGILFYLMIYLFSV